MTKFNDMRLLFLFVVFTLFISSCTKEDEYHHAIVRDGGDVAVDGCGWLIEMESTGLIYKPVQFPDTFKTDGLEVTLVYVSLDSKANCGFAPLVYDEIRILKIRPITE
jgi:hypothetical protein